MHNCVFPYGHRRTLSSARSVPPEPEKAACRSLPKTQCQHAVESLAVSGRCSPRLLSQRDLTWGWQPRRFHCWAGASDAALGSASMPTARPWLHPCLLHGQVAGLGPAAVSNGEGLDQRAPESARVVPAARRRCSRGCTGVDELGDRFCDSGSAAVRRRGNITILSIIEISTVLIGVIPYIIHF